jgi:hypothetical protein
LAWAGVASATVVDVSISGDFFSFQGPAGFYTAPSGASPTITTSAGVEHVNFGDSGGSAYNVAFAYDTATGSLTGGGASAQTFTGAIASGAFNWGDAGISQNLAGDSLTISRALGASLIEISGGSYSFDIQYSGAAAPFSLTSPYSFSCRDCQVGPGGNDGYNSANVHTFSTEALSGSSAPVAPGGIPEPATWTLLLAGFFGLGSAIRAQRRYGAAVRL